jgi:putative inorganic carbon (HCO3(-)) transporter
VPIIAAVFIAVAPGKIADRYASMFNMNDPTVRDRYVMLRIGQRMVRAHPLTGVGPNMVQRQYVDYTGPDSLVGPDGVTHINPHLHNDFLQIAAERGLPALALWLWFIAALLRDLWNRFHAGQRELAATAMATVAALLTAGLFEYNFGDSEVLMLFLTIVTLPAAAARPLRG